MTARQQEALDFIRANQRIVMTGPSHRELAEHLGIAANAAQQKVNALRGAGYIAPANGRGLVLKSSSVEVGARKKKIPNHVTVHDDTPEGRANAARDQMVYGVGVVLERKPILRPSGKI